MSWLTDLAGKAENLLNKIDQNAAVVLKDKNLINEQLQDVIWKATPSARSANLDPSSVTSLNSQISSPPPLPRSAPSGAASPARRPSPSRSDINYLKRNDEDDLLRFLNSSDSTQYGTEELRGSPSGASVPSAGSSSPVYLVDTPRGHSRSHSQGGMSSMASSYVSSGQEEQLYQQCFKPVEVVDSYIQRDEVTQLPVNDILAENNLLKNEIRCLNNEVTLLLHRSKAAERGADIARQELEALKEMLAQNEDVNCQMRALKTQVKDSEKAVLTLSAENQRLKDSQVAFSSQDSKLAEELTATIARLKQQESENNSLTQESHELHLQVSRLQATINDAVQQNDRYRQQILEVSSEAEQYRARATRVLQEKEKLISSLQAAKCMKGETTDSTVDQENEQLREELNLLRQESASQSKLLLSVRNDLQTCELRQEEQRQKAETEIDRLHKKLQQERSHRVAAEEDSRAHLEELQLAKKQMNHQNELLQNQLQAKDAELSHIKQQAQISSNVSKPSSDIAELEARVRNLATSLIQKQGALEALIAERNSLRLKLERIESQKVSGSCSLPSSSSNGGTVLSLNESENGARMRVPTLLSENPGDTGVTRRVKRAYSSLDTLGIRVGTFLRRYPLARILVIVYMVLLHFWVAIVLLSYTPEGQSIKTPPAVTY